MALTALSLRPEDSSPLRRLSNVHWGPLFALAILSLIGVATIGSATSELAGDYWTRQSLWLLIGSIALILCFVIDYHRLVDFAPVFYGVGLLLLVLVLTVGREAGGARSWLDLGPLGGQPSELVKIATALLLARYLARRRRVFLRFNEIVIAVAIAAVPMLLIALQKDLGVAATFAPLVVGPLLVAGIRPRFLAIGSVCCLVLAIGMWNFGMRDYQRERIRTFLSPHSDPLGSGYQVRQSKIAVGSGQVFGRGYGQGTQSQLRFLPARHTDFIMAVLAEEWGLAGVASVLALFSFYIYSASRIALRGRDRPAIILIVALVSLFAFHIIYNTGMAVGLLPITGIPLPFLSYGGSFTLANFIATGLILNVDYRRYVNR